MLANLISSARMWLNPASVPFDPDRWETELQKARAILEKGEPRRARVKLEMLLQDGIPLDWAGRILYSLGLAFMHQGKLDSARTCFAGVVRIAESLESPEAAVDSIELWAKSLDMEGEADAAAPIRQKQRELTQALFDHVWTKDEATGVVTHRVTGIRFPPTFGKFVLDYCTFSAMDGSEARVTYTAAPPDQGEAIIDLRLNNGPAEAGLCQLSDEAVWWLGLPESDFLYGHFSAGTDPEAPVGVRRLWPPIERHGTRWILETCFAAFGDLHIAMRVANLADDFDPKENEILLEEFDWPHPGFRASTD